MLGVDSSAWAIDQARANAQANGLENVSFATGEAFAMLQSLAAEGQRFGAVILDPPRFAGSARSIDAALRAYHRLNRLAVELLEPEGILVTSSCSGRVTREDFRDMLFGVGLKARCDLQILEQRGAAPGSPGAGLLPRDRISEMLHLPRGVTVPPYAYACPTHLTPSATLAAN